jgi:hypothetical protein
MDSLVVISLIVLGAAIGALLTRIASTGEIRRLKAEIERHARQEDSDKAA